MRILQVFNRYAYVGGEEIAVRQISEELSHHHEFRAVTFDSQEWIGERGIFSYAKQFFAMAWNPGSIREVRREIEEFKPDVLILHNIMPVGSAGLYLFLAECKVPVVQFIHNFRPFSVNGYCWGDGKILAQGLEKNFLPEVMAAGWQNSRVKTAWYAILIWFLHKRGVYQKIDGWIAVSNFMKRTFVDAGIAEERVRVISHSWDPQCSDAEVVELAVAETDPCFLFLGRLTEEKGIKVLLDAWRRFESKSEVGRLVIAGEGPLSKETKRQCGSLKRASWVGFKSGEEKTKLLRECTALVVPSVWWEPLGLVLYEAYDYGKPVLAARSGGIVDHAEDGVTGWLHEPGDARRLAEQMLEAASNRELCRLRGANGRRHLLNRSASVWIDDFDAFVQGVIEGARKEGREAEGVADPLTESEKPLRITAYLADQNPKLSRSLGISRMTNVVLSEMAKREGLELTGITSRSSIQMPMGTKSIMVPWSTRSRTARVLTDHLHPLMRLKTTPDVWYFPKGFLPRVGAMKARMVVTIHDTIIQYYSDHYPRWRMDVEYHYWASILKHTLRKAEAILTVSESAKCQIMDFMKRHDIPDKEIIVTYEPCLYEQLPQPENPAKADYVLHLASREPHKRTTWLIELWAKWHEGGRKLPRLHVVGKLPYEVIPVAERCPAVVRLPFLDDDALVSQFTAARALLLPSEVEGFGLPAIEAYYLGTPVCYVAGTSVEEVLAVATSCGGFRIGDPESLFRALEEVEELSPEEVRHIGLRLRDEYAAHRVVDRILEVCERVGGKA